MAVPKKRKSHLKSRKKYTINHNKKIINRTVYLNENDLYNILKDEMNLNELVIVKKNINLNKFNKLGVYYGKNKILKK
jgi:hypothetical protein